MSHGETVAWLESLYGRCTADDGEIVLSPKSKRQTVGAFKVGSGDALVAAAKAMAGKTDHYVKVNLMDADAMRERSRRENKGNWIVGGAAEVKTVVSFHLDADAGKSKKYLDRSEMLDCLNAMPVPPSLIVNSDGPEGGFHVYWILQHPYRIQSDDDRKHIGKLATRWQAKLSGITGGKLDATADLCRFLRVVGQGRSNGNEVYAEAYEPDRLYSLRDLTVPVDQDEIKREAKRLASKIIEDTLGNLDDVDDWTTAYLKHPVQTYVDSCRILPEQLFGEEGWTDLGNGDWMRPDSESGNKTATIATKTPDPGANFFSGNESRFPCSRGDTPIGAFHSVYSIFVGIRFGGDWKAAADWCRQQLYSEMTQGIDFSGIEEQSRRQSA